MIDSFADPSHICVFDGFDDASLDTTYVWLSKTENGSTTVTESGSPLGVLTIANNGAGTAGGAWVSTSQYVPFGRHMRFSVDIQINTGDVIADGNLCDAWIILYANATNYISFGPRRLAPAGTNTIGYIQVYTSGVLTTALSSTTTILDNNKRNYTVIVTDSHVLFYIDYELVHSLIFDHLFNVGYFIHLYAATNDNTDVIDVDFDNFEAFNCAEPTETLLSHHSATSSPELLGPYHVLHDSGASQAVCSLSAYTEILGCYCKCIQANTAGTTCEIGWAGDTDALMTDGEVPDALNGFQSNRYPADFQTSARSVIATVGADGGDGEWNVWLLVLEF